jgi:hypothetical protein
VSNGEIGSGERTTRRPHQCAYCARDLPAGSRAAWWTWAEGGRIETSYAHPECQVAWSWYAADCGLAGDDPLPDPAEFQSEVLAEHRRVVAAAGLVGAGEPGTPQGGDGK